jgi:hypothetical protein
VHELKAQLIVAETNNDARVAEQKEVNELNAKIKSLEDENGTLRGKVRTFYFNQLQGLKKKTLYFVQKT